MGRANRGALYWRRRLISRIQGIHRRHEVRMRRTWLTSPQNLRGDRDVRRIGCGLEFGKFLDGDDGSDGRAECDSGLTG
jgi:hypothetical protein